MGTVTQKNRGFTLVEMVVTAALVGILSVGIVSVFISTVQGGKTARAQANVKTQGDYAITSMERSIRNATSLPVCSADSHTITFQYLGTDGVPVTQEYRYYEATDQIEVFKGGVSQGFVIKSGQVANAMTVTDARFTCNAGVGVNPGTVSITMTLQTVGDARQQTAQQFQTTVVMRNIP